MHLRNRYLSEIILKKRKILPIVGVFGARQVGKSTLLRDLIGKKERIPYYTLDRQELLREAKKAGENFILSRTDEFTKPIIIDEAHKAPNLFDALKVLADEKKKRGIIILTGSVEFTEAQGVRETLTGRIGTCRLYPLTIGELIQDRANNVSKPTPSDVQAWLERGGMPAICQLRDQSEREALIEDWLQSVCMRDLLQLKGARYDGVIAREILQIVAKFPEYSQGEIAREMGEDSRIIGKHLRALKALYVITEVRPDKKLGSSGFTRFFLLDSAVACYLGASGKTSRTILLINEILAKHEYSGKTRPVLSFLSVRGNTHIDLMFESILDKKSIVVSDKVEIDQYHRRSLKVLIAKGVVGSISIAAPIVEKVKLEKGIELVPIQDFCI